VLDFRDWSGAAHTRLAAGVLLPDTLLAVASHLLATVHFILRHALSRKACQRRNSHPQEQQREYDG
jgi:hypothetical protein